MSLLPSPSASTGCNYTCKLYFDPRADQPSTGGYWITDEELRQKLANLIDTEEKIKNASVYSSPLSSWQLTNAKFYHAFIIMETNNWWWSIEKNMECITIQRSKNLESVRDMYQRKKRTTGWTSLTSIRKNETAQGGNTTFSELINYIWRKDCVTNVYHVLIANCQGFAGLVFNRIRSPHNDLMYFDEAADQQPSTTSSCYMSVDSVLNQVQRLSASETFTKIELYKVPMDSLNIPDYFTQNAVVSDLVGNTVMTSAFAIFVGLDPIAIPVLLAGTYLARLLMYSHYFVIFETNNGIYWSLDRLPNRFTIQRSRNKATLLKECQRISRDSSLIAAKRYKSADAKAKTMNAVMEFILKNCPNKNQMYHLPPEHCGTEACRVFDHFKLK